MPEIGIGLDLATHSTGAFVGVGDQFKQAFMITVPKVDANDWSPMATLVKSFLDLHKPDYVCIEDTYFGENAETRRRLDRLAGAVINWCDENKIATYVGATTTIDKHCGITLHLKRPERKKELKRFAAALGFVLPQDTCDALAVLFWGMGARKEDRISEGTWDAE